MWEFQRFGNIAGLFEVMSVAIRALDKDDVDPQFMTKLAKIAGAEIISTKVQYDGDYFLTLECDYCKFFT